MDSTLMAAAPLVVFLLAFVTVSAVVLAFGHAINKRQTKRLGTG